MGTHRGGCHASFRLRAQGSGLTNLSLSHAISRVQGFQVSGVSLGCRVFRFQAYRVSLGYRVFRVSGLKPTPHAHA